MKIYLNGQMAEPEQGGAVVLTRQANDITKPDHIQADYSNAVRFPKTKHNQQLFGFAEEVDSDTLTPYRIQEAQLFSEGIEVVPHGKFELQESAEAYEGQLYSGNIRFFDALENKKLADLDLSEYDHAWTLANIAANMLNTEGFCYPLLDIGMGLNPASVLSRHVYPATYAKMLFEKIFAGVGFAYDLTVPEMFSRLILPAADIPKYSKAFMDARSYYGYVPVESIEYGAPESGRGEINRIIPYVTTDKLPFFSGSNGNYNKGTVTYTADKAVFVDVAASIYASLNVPTGTASGRLYICKNGVEIGYHKLRTTDIENSGGSLNELWLNVSLTDILLQPGDTLDARLKLKGETSIVKWGYQLYHFGTFSGSGILSSQQKTEAAFQITVKETMPEGADIDLRNWVPDMTQKEFVKAMVKLFGWTFQTDAYENRIKITPFSDVLQNKSIAKDWTDKRDFTNVPTVAYRFGEFGQRNLFTWAEDESVKAGLGDGILPVDNQTLELEYEALSMPFAATDMVNGFPSVPVWEGQKGGAEIQDSDFAARGIEPRLLIRKDTKQATTITQGGSSANLESWKFYFTDATEAFDLDMQRTIIPAFYSTLLAVLNKCKHVQAYYRLSAQDVQEFDQSVPVWDANLGQYFYLNQIEQYEEGKPTLVHLFRLNEPVIQTINS